MGQRRQATRELIARYAQAVRSAWHRRHEMAPQRRTSDEAAFLPAALSLQETPVHPAPKIIIRLIVSFALIAFLWAVFGKMDIVATATGQIIPSDRTKVIQPLTTSVVKSIHVQDGQRVTAGELLIALDPTVANADRSRLRSELLTARLEGARAKAMLQVVTGNGPLIDLRDRFPGVAPERLQEEQELLDGHHDEFQSRLAQLKAEVATRTAERESLLESVSKLKELLPIVRQRAADYKNLFEKQYVARHTYLEQEQRRIATESDLASQKAELREIETSLESARRRIQELMAETRRAQLDLWHNAKQKILALEQELIKADQRERLTQLKAPVSGIVQQLAVHTAGGVVTEAQPLMVIVPEDDRLEVDAFLENKDIGFVHTGQPVAVKIQAFPYTKYGTIPGEVRSISADAVQHEKLGPVYTARVALQRSDIPVGDKLVRLAPGMTVSAEIKTGKRRVIEYFLSPLLVYQSESLRER